MSEIYAVERVLETAGILDRLRDCEDLPTPPGIAERILELADDTNSTMSDVAELVSADPALAARLLRLANSPAYGQRRTVETLTQACVLLGLSTTLQCALSLALVDSFSRRRSRGIDHSMFWRRSLAAASACRNLGRRIRADQPEAFFMAGLIQDVGMLAVETIEPSLYAGLNEGQTDHLYVTEFEQAYIGIDHVRIGAWLLQEWHLPEKYCVATLYSHDPVAASAIGDHSQIAMCAAVSGLIADAVYHPDMDIVIERALTATRDVLCLSTDQFVEIIETTCDDVVALADLFDIDLGSADDMDVCRKTVGSLIEVSPASAAAS